MSQQYAPELIQSMREWIADCSWPDLEPGDEQDLSDTEVLAGIRTHYEGGILQFIADNTY